MGVLYRIRIELLVLFLVSLIIFITLSPDLWFYNYFKTINKDLSGVFLKEFFVEITRLGNSLWYFSIAIIGFIFFYFNKKFKIIEIKSADKIINFFITSFFYILAVGLVTQIGKHVIGRSRPNYTNLDQGSEFNFFTLNSNFHSFPSGHSSTIFIVCFIVAVTFPKLKYFFYFLSSIIALSRVVVGAHFFTDIIAGALLALIMFKILNYLLEKNYNHYKFSNVDFLNNSDLFYYFLFLFFSSIFITTASSLDLYVSSLFYYGNSQFALQSFNILSVLLRDIFLPLILIYILALPILGRFVKLDKIFFGYNFSVKEICLLWISQIVCVLIFVNLILKNFWGRARPNDVLELGGKETFTSWFEITSSCESNCSFVSGDASVGFSIVLLYLISKKLVFLYISIVAGFMLGLVRIMAGGHFLSDIFFAGIFIVSLNVIIFEIYKRYYVK